MKAPVTSRIHEVVVWRLAADELPADTRTVLVDTVPRIAFFDGASGIWRDHDGNRIAPPHAWAPMPRGPSA